MIHGTIAEMSPEARTERLYWFLRNMGLIVEPEMQDGQWRALRVSVFHPVTIGGQTATTAQGSAATPAQDRQNVVELPKPENATITTPWLTRPVAAPADTTVPRLVEPDPRYGRYCDWRHRFPWQ